MQTSTLSLSRSCCLGSNESSISASLRHGVVEKDLLQLTRALDLGLSNMHRRRAGANCEYAAVANLGALFDCVRARLARGTERGFGGILGAALGFRRSAWWDALPRRFVTSMGISRSRPPLHAIRGINRASTGPIGVVPDPFFHVTIATDILLRCQLTIFFGTSNSASLCFLAPPPNTMSDQIYIQNLRLSAIVGPDAWHRSNKPQPLILSARLHINTSAAGSSDDIRETVSYGEICKVVTSLIEREKAFYCIEQLGWKITALAEEHKWGGQKFEVEVKLPKGVLRAEGGISFRCCVVRDLHGQGTESQWKDGEEYSWLIKDLTLACVIGVNPHERVEKQAVMVNLHILSCSFDENEVDHSQTHWQKLVKRNCEVRDTINTPIPVHSRG